MEIISMKQNGSSMKFNISLKDASDGDMSEDYNIYNFVIVRFRVVTLDSQRRRISIAMQKHKYGKGLTLSVKVSSSMSDNEDIICSENWSDWIWLNSTEQWFIDVDIKINFKKTYTIPTKKFHEDETLTDFQLSAGDGSVAVHKSFLAAHSDMFKTMFHGEWKETAQGHVELKGVTRQNLQHFKDFMYLGTLPDENDELRPLLLLADRYLVEHLRAECMMKVMQTITPENLDTHLEFAAENKMHDLNDNIWQYIPDSCFASAYAIKMKALMGKIETSSSDKE